MEIYIKFVNAQTCKMNICTFLKITISEQINGKKLIKKKKITCSLAGNEVSWYYSAPVWRF